MGRREEERVALDEAIPLADEIGDPSLRARARIALAAHLGNTSQYDAAMDMAREVLVLSREAGDRKHEALAHEYLGLITMSQGKLDEAQQHNEAALEIHEEIAQPRGRVNLLGNQGHIEEALGRPDKARAMHEEAAALARQVGDREGAALAAGNLGTLAYGRGRMAVALAHYEDALAVFTEIGTRRPMANSLANLGELWLLLGNLGKARECTERAIAIGEEIEYEFLIGWAKLVLADVAVAEGRPDDALPLVYDGLERMRVIGSPDHIANALVTLAELAENVDRKQELLAEAMEVQGAEGEAVIAMAMGGATPAEAATAMEEREGAMRREQRMYARYLLWTATAEKRHLERAHAILTELREHAPEECRDSMVEHNPLHRDIMLAWADGS